MRPSVRNSVPRTKGHDAFVVPPRRPAIASLYRSINLVELSYSDTHIGQLFISSSYFHQHDFASNSYRSCKTHISINLIRSHSPTRIFKIENSRFGQSSLPAERQETQNHSFTRLSPASLKDSPVLSNPANPAQEIYQSTNHVSLPTPKSRDLRSVRQLRSTRRHLVLQRVQRPEPGPFGDMSGLWYRTSISS